MEILTLTGGGNTVTFNDAPFVLSSIDAGPSDGESRAVTLKGYIVSDGATEAARLAYLTEKRSLLCRTVMADGGFTVSRGNRAISAKADKTPRFASDAVFSGSDACMFEITATAAPMYRSSSGETVFGGAVSAGATHGSISITNPGDVAVGVRIEIDYASSAIAGLSIGVGGDTVVFAEPSVASGRVTVNTRDGEKTVTVGSAVSYSAVTGSSVFFKVPVGQSAVTWTAESAGVSAVRVYLVPLFYER